MMQAKKQVSYVESDDEGDDGEDIFKPLSGNTKNQRALKRQRVVLESSDDEFGLDAVTQAAMLEESKCREH